MTKSLLHSTVQQFNLPKENTAADSFYFSQKQCEELFNAIKSNPLSNSHAYLGIHLPTNSLLFHHNLAPFFGVSQEISLLQFFDFIHPDYVSPFLKWAKAAYLLCESLQEIIPLEKCYKIRIPMRNALGEYYWVLQESYILQYNNTQNIIIQLNIYTIIEKYDLWKEILPSMHNVHGIDKRMNEQLLYFFNTISDFSLTEQETLLLKTIRANAALNYKKIGQLLDIQEETVKKHAKNVLKKAKNAFDAQFNSPEKATIKNLIYYLEQINYFKG